VPKRQRSSAGGAELRKVLPARWFAGRVRRLGLRDLRTALRAPPHFHHFLPIAAVDSRSTTHTWWTQISVAAIRDLPAGPLQMTALSKVAEGLSRRNPALAQRLPADVRGQGHSKWVRHHCAGGSDQKRPQRFAACRRPSTVRTTSSISTDLGAERSRCGARMGFASAPKSQQSAPWCAPDMGDDELASMMGHRASSDENAVEVLRNIYDSGARNDGGALVGLSLPSGKSRTRRFVIRIPPRAISCHATFRRALKIPDTRRGRHHRNGREHLPPHNGRCSY
jgi:hypothetical protein